MAITKKREAARAALYVEIQKLYDRGLNSKEIGVALGMSGVKAASNMRCMGLPPRAAKCAKASVKKPTKTPEPVKLMTMAQIAAASGWRPLSNRDRVSLDMDISRAIAAVRLNPDDELAKDRVQVLIGRRDRDDCARQAQRAAA